MSSVCIPILSTGLSVKMNPTVICELEYPESLSLTLTLTVTIIVSYSFHHRVFLFFCGSY